MTTRQRSLATAGDALSDEATTVQRAFVHLAFRQLRLDHSATPNEAEEAMRRIHAGQLDSVIERFAPSQERPAVRERYVDVRPFSHEAWKARHGVKD
jgi:hypothetical protein